MRASPTRHRVALAIALVGMAVSVFILVIHRRIAGDPGYTSFCNLGGAINCDAVLGSSYGMLFGVSVAAWSVLAFGVGAALALPGAVGATAAGVTDIALLGLVSGTLGFGLVLLGVQHFLLQHYCLLCLTLDAVIVAWFVTVVPLVSRFAPGGASGWWQRRTVARAMAASGVVLAVTGGTWAAVRGPGPATTVAEVRTRDPKFYEWYSSLPVRPMTDLVTPDCHRKGPPDAPLSVVEFSDFQCPFCAQAFRDLRALMRERPEMSLVFRHFPLDTSCNSHVSQALHPDACLAACAAECAGQQGRFWEYHDVLFENHDHLERESLFRYARKIGLDLAAFRTCLESPDTRDRIGLDIEAGVRAGVSSTPTLFINGRMVAGALEPPYYDYAVIIDGHAHAAHGPAGS